MRLLSVDLVPIPPFPFPDLDGCSPFVFLLACVFVCVYVFLVVRLSFLIPTTTFEFKLLFLTSVGSRLSTAPPRRVVNRKRECVTCERATTMPLFGCQGMVHGGQIRLFPDAIGSRSVESG